MYGATYRRNTAALGLLATALLSAVSVLLQPHLGSTPGQRLTAIDDAGVRAQVSAVAFVLAQLPAIVGLLGIAHIIRTRAPRLSVAGGTLSVLGTFGHAVFGGITLVYLVMASDAGPRSTYAALIERVESTPVMIFSLFGLVGTVLGFALLAIGLWRSRTVQAWVPALLGLWLVIEFAGSGISRYAEPASALLFVVATTALAIRLWQSPVSSWSPAEAASPLPRQPMRAAG